MFVLSFGRQGSHVSTDSGKFWPVATPAELDLTKACVRAIWHCTLSVMLAVVMLLTLVSMAMAASAGCNAINSGVLNYTGKSQPLQTKTILLTNFYGGDQLTYTHTSTPGRSGTKLILSAGPLYLTRQTTTARTHTLSGTVGTVLGLELLNLAATAQSEDPDSGVLLGGLLGTPTDIVVTVTCIPAPSPTTLAVTSNSPTVFGQPASLTATVTAADGGTATGSVVFSVDGVAQAPVALASGVATLDVPGLSVASHTVSAAYAGSSAFTASSGTLAGGHTVGKAATSTAVTSSTGSASFGSSVTFTATVAATAPGTGTPSGSVIFTLDGVDQAPVALNGSGVATISSTTLGVGSKPIAARYVTSTNYAASSGSLSGGQTITQAATSTAVSQSAATTIFGQPVTFTATVGSGVGTPSGSVVFIVDGVTQAPVSLNGSGIATLATSSLAVGSHSVSAGYAGTANLAASVGSLSGGHQVDAIVTTTSLAGPGAIVYGASASITATVTSASGTPTGSITFTVDGTPRAPVALSAGSASVSLTGLGAGTHSVSADYAGTASFAASSGTLGGGQVVGKAVTSTAVSPITTVSLGQSLSLAATVSSSAGTPSGSITFTVDGIAQSPVALVNGQANLLVPGLGVGSHSVTAAYSGDANFATSSSSGASGSIAKASSSLLVASATNPAVSGQGIAFTATASASTGTPTGSVIFTVDGVAQPASTLSAGGVATLNFASLPVGTHSVSAAYQGDANLLASSASLAGGQAVARAASTLSLTSDTASPALGAAVSFTAQLAAVAPAAGVPTGNVVFSIDGAAQAPVAISNGSASITRSSLGVGTHVITALYAGDADFTPSSGTLSGGQAVVAASTATSLAVTPANPSFGGTATLTASVTSTGGTPAGNVIFTVNGTDRAPVSLVDGSAELALNNLAVGSYTLGARFVATTSYLASAALDRSLTVSSATTTTTVGASPASIRLGESTLLSASVSSASGVPTGVVEFYAETTLLGSGTLSNGAASLSTSALGLGDRSITARYLGSTNHVPSIGTLAGVLAVAPAATSLTLVGSPAAPRYGDTVVLTATVSSPAGAPAGSVVFTIDGVAQPATALVNGVATLPLAALEPGIHSASVSYVATAGNEAASASISGGIVVIKADAALAVTSSPATPVFGSSVTVTATLTSPAGTPSGDVVFVIDGVARAPVTPTAGIASLGLPGLAAGTHTVEARFAGDSRFNAITVTAPSITVATAGTSMVLGASPSSSRFGDAVALTATLASPGGTPTGVVVFSIDGAAQAPVSLSNGVAALTTAGLTVGPHTVTASYAAQDSFGASSATLGGGIDVDVASTITAVTGPAGPLTVGDSARFTATVTASHGTPSGVVLFAVDGVTQAPVTLVNGVASLDRVFSAAGNHVVSATYTGAANFAPSAGSLATSLAVDKAATQLAVTAPASREFGAALVVSATASSLGGTPTGTVIFYVDAVQIGSGILTGGVASMTLPQQVAGNHTVTAAYGGDLNFNPSVASGAVIAVTAAATDTTITATPTTVATGEPTTVTITVYAASNHAAATGSVTVTVGTTDYVVPLVNGVATLVLTDLAPGTYAVSADYAGGGNFAPSDAMLGTSLVIQPPPTDIHVSASLPRSVAGTPYAGSFTAFGGVPFTAPAAPYRYVLSGGALPAGLVLDPDSGALAGTPTGAGSYSWQVTATGFAGAPGVYDAQLTVLAPATITLPASLADGIFGVEFGQSVAASGGTAPRSYAVSMGALPQGVSLDAATGALSGAPTQLGNASFMIAVTDANGFTGSRAYTVAIVAPTIAVSGSFPAGTVGVSYPATTPTVSGGALPRSFSFDGTLPPGLMVDTATGALSGTPTQAGSFSFGIIATDANGFSGRLALSTTIVTAPVILLPPTLATPRENRPYSQAVSASGGTPDYSYDLASGTLPPGLTLNAGTGRISGTPTSSGPYTFVIRATDATTLSGSRSYTLNVQAAAVLVVDSTIGPIMARTPFDESITVSGGRAPYSFTVVSGTPPAGILIDAATGRVHGTATVPGAYNLVLDIADADGDTVTVPLNLQVLLPTIVVSATLNDHNFGSPATGAISASGGTAPYTYAVTAGALPANVAISATGGVSGTATEAGAFNLVLTATDANGFTGSAAVAFAITPPTLGLSTLPLQYMLTRPVNQTVTASGGTAPYALALSGNLPDGLSFDGATGALTGTPTATGLRSFTITATDAFGFVVARTYAVETVTNIGAATLPGTLPAATAGVPYTGTLTATGGATPLVYAITAGTLPLGLSLDTATGVISGTTVATGSFPITLTVTGADTRINSAGYTLQVNAPSITAGGGLAGAVAGVAYSQAIPVSGGNAPYGVVLKSGSLPAGLGLAASGLLSGTPTEAGSFAFVATVTDANGFAADIPFSLSVAAPSIALSASVSPGRIGLVYAGAVTASGGVGPYQFVTSTGTLPAGLSLALDGSLGGTPTAAGSTTVTITATDANGFSGARSYEFVIASNIGVATLGALDTPIFKTAYSDSVAASGGNAPYTYAVTPSTLPTGLSLNTSSGAITGTPTAAGSFSFTITVTDATGLINQQTYALTIAPPVITVSLTPPAGRVGVALVPTTATVTGGTAPYGFALQNAPPGVAINAGTGVISGTPTQLGTYNFNVVVTDADNFVTARSFAMSIGAAPVVLNLPASLPAGVTATPYSVSLVPDNAVGAVSYSLTGGTSLPLGLSLNGATGVISGTPILPGSTSIIVRAQDADGNIGTANYALAVTLTPPLFVATSIDLDASATAVVVGQSFTVTANVLTTTGHANNGLITLVDDVSGAILGVNVIAADGSASFNLSFDSTASRTLSAHYAGGIGFAASNEVGDSITVTPAATNLALSGTSGSVPILTPIVLVANVTRTAPATGSAGAGSIVFSVDGTDTLTVPAILGSGSFITAGLPPGEHRIGARFISSSGSDLGSSDEAVIQVKAPTLTLLTAPLGEILFGQSTTFTATVTPIQLGVPMTGNVVFRDNGTVVGTVPLASGTASYTLSPTAVGIHLVTAEYVGDNYYNGSIALGLSLNVLALPSAPLPTTTSLNASNLTPQIGEPLLLTATVVANGIAIPTGTIVFVNDTTGDTLGTGTINIAGIAVLAMTLTDGRPVNISANYPGDLLTQPSSATVTIDPVAAATSVTLASSATNVLPGDDVTLTATVSRQAGGQPDAGSIAFYADGVAFALVPTNGSASVTATSDPLSGPTSFTAGFLPGLSSTDDASQSTPLVVTAAQAVPTVAMTAVITPDGRGMVDVTVSPPAGFSRIPTGTVLLQVAGMADQSLTLVNGAARFTYPAGSFSGARSFTADYSGDIRYTPASEGISVAVAATMPTQTTVSVSRSQLMLNEPLTVTVAVSSGFQVGEGQVEIFDDGTLVGTVPVLGGTASLQLASLDPGANVITANYLGSANYSPSSGNAVTVTVALAPPGDLSMALTADSRALFSAGQSITLTAVIGANGAAAGNIAMASSLGFSCPQTTLAAGQSMACTATYRVTAADIAAGRVDFSATVTADAMAPATAQLSLSSAVDEIAETFRNLSDDFVSERARVIGNAIPLPDIFERRRNISGSRAGTVQASGDGLNQTLAFASSLQDWRNYAASQAADELALAIAEEPVPLNIWIDSQFTMHGSTEDDGRWGSLGTVAIGADYLFSEDFMAGIMVQGDWASQTSPDGMVSGQGFLIGPYVSIALSDNISFDATVLYGQSSNEISATLFDEGFRGSFGTTRLNAKGALSGFFEVDALTIRPNATFILSSESIGAYQVSNADGDTVTVPGGDQLHYQLTVGTTFEYEIMLDDGATLTPMLGLDVGISGNSVNGADATQTLLGRVSTGLEYETEAGLVVGLEFSTELDSGGFSSAEIRASIKGRF